MRPTKENTLIVIPARIGSRRFPRKPLALIDGRPMVEHVWQRAVAARRGEVVVATDDKEIADTVRAAGGFAVITSALFSTGTDRVAEAARLLDPERKAEFVVNVQGDMPFIDPKAIRKCIAVLGDEELDMATLAAPMLWGEGNSPHVVKVALNREGHAVDFSRHIGNLIGLYRHIGVYAFRRAVLTRLAMRARSRNELHRDLEQMRAVDTGMKIGVAVIEEAPAEINTPEDLVGLVVPCALPLAS